MKKDAYYFSHDANAQEDPKCVLLIEQLGMEGYGIYWGLVERLRQEKEYKLPLIILPALSRKWNTSKEKVDVVIRQFGLFEIEGEMFFSIRLSRSMDEYNVLRNKYIEYGRKGGLTSAQARLKQPSSIKVKKSKVKESKKILFSDSDFFDKDKFKKAFPDWNTTKLKYYYDSILTWSNEGNKKIDWIATARTWANRDEREGKIKFTNTNHHSNQPVN